MSQPLVSGIVCGQCRHANHLTDDALEGFLACPWLGATFANCPCAVVFEDSQTFAFEPYHGNNGTWRIDSEWRSLPLGYEHRPVTFPGISNLMTAAGGLCEVEPIHGENHSEGRIQFLQCEPECYVLQRPVSFWRSLWSGGNLDSGSVVVTDTDVLFLRSTVAQRVAGSGPCPSTEVAANSMLEIQGGYKLQLIEVSDVAVTFEGHGAYRHGKALVADVTMTDLTGKKTTFRFLGTTSAHEFMNAISY